MNVSKQDIFNSLIGGYVKAPPSLKDQAITTLAIQLNQNIELKDIIYESDPMQYRWEKLIKERSTNICQKLPLPPVLKDKLICYLRAIVLQAYNWNRQQDRFNLSLCFLKNCLHPSDWRVVEMRLDEIKIAKLLVQDESIPVCQRYKMSCFHCLEDSIIFLWSKISPERRYSDLFLHQPSALVQLWYLHLSGEIEKLIVSEDDFWRNLLKAGLLDDSKSSVLQCWDKLDIGVKQEVLKNTAMATVLLFDSSSRQSDADIFCFLLTQISKEHRVELFQEIFQNAEINVLVLFLQRPYMELLIPIIKDLWNILPEEKYGQLLFTLASHYWDENPYDVGRKDYRNYEYGYLIIELLDETPDHFKRYVFGAKYQEDADLFVEVEVLLYTILNRGNHKLHYREIFHHIWKHVTLEEKRLFLRSYYGEIFCRNLATKHNWELFTSILRECVPEGEIPMFKKAVLDMN